MAKHSICHVEWSATDLARAKVFFSELFGWRFDSDNPMDYGIVDREENLSPDGVGISGGVGGATGDHPGHLTFYVAVPDVEAALAKAESLGGTRVMGPEVVPGARIEIGHLTDPEGHLIGVMRPLP